MTLRPLSALATLLPAALGALLGVASGHPLLGLALGLAGSSALMLALAWRGSSDVRVLTRAAESISSGDFSPRIRHIDRGELGALAAAMDEMAARLEAKLEEAGRSREELRALLSGMGEGVIATDRRQRILFLNQAATALLDVEVDAPSGRMLWEVVRENEIVRAAKTAFESGERQKLQVGPVRNRHLDVSAYPWPASGTPEGVVIVAHDATESVRYQELRKEFVANVSHELRTPLTMIKGFVETLRDGALADAVKGPEFLATIDKHVDQLTNLVSDLLELSRLESREGLPRMARVDVAATLGKIVEFMKPAAEKRRQSLELSVNGRLPGVAGDPDYLDRAVSNLVDNAIKYTPEGGSIRVLAKPDDGYVVIEVTDTGIGIPKQDVPRVFERFYRVDKSRSREMGGTGLGLSIVKHVVQVHGGAVEVESTVGKGSTFRVRLPAIVV